MTRSPKISVFNFYFYFQRKHTGVTWNRLQKKRSDIEVEKKKDRQEFIELLRDKSTFWLEVEVQGRLSRLFIVSRLDTLSPSVKVVCS